jgi:hypothetical protein
VRDGTGIAPIIREPGGSAGLEVGVRAPTSRDRARSDAPDRALGPNLDAGGAERHVDRADLIGPQDGRPGVFQAGQDLA